MRPWLAMRVKEIEFEEEVVPFEMATGNAHFDKFSPTGKVPCLIDGNLAVPESLAILEYLADRFPEKELWPADIGKRATARAISCQMLEGFRGLRKECPMNMARKPSTLKIGERAQADVIRIEQIWDECLQKSGGPFLFGEFCNADAMFAPVVNRMEIYFLSDTDAVKSFSSAIKELSAWKDWEAAGRAEPWIVDVDEV